MLLRSYTLRTELSNYDPLSQKANAIADLSEDISEVLPYLNTVLKGLQCNKEEKTLTLKRGGRLITFYPRQIVVTKLKEENEVRVVIEGLNDAKAVIEELKRILNETFANKDHIKPTYTFRPLHWPLHVFKLLPGRDCKECGESTCTAFALKLINDEMEWRQCPLLLTKEFETNRLKLIEIFPDSEE